MTNAVRNKWLKPKRKLIVANKSDIITSILKKSIEKVCPKEECNRSLKSLNPNPCNM